jgi:hypothetical protein
MIFYGKIKDFAFHPDNQRLWLTHLESIDGKKVYIDLNLEKAKRSLDQNAFMWVYLEIIANETGNIADDLHRIFKGLFLPKKSVVLNGKTYMMSGSTTDLTKAEMGEYLDQICALTGIPIPNQANIPS